MKMYRILAIALLMSGIMHARSITVVNNAPLKIRVGITPPGKMVNGACSTINSSDILSKSFGAGVSADIIYSDCATDSAEVEMNKWNKGTWEHNHFFYRNNAKSGMKFIVNSDYTVTVQ